MKSGQPVVGNNPLDANVPNSTTLQAGWVSHFVQQFGALFGRHFMQVSDAKHLVGNFNAHLRDCVVLFGDEAFYAGDRRHESVLKTLITSREINIEGKGLDVETQPNYIHLLMVSNAEWVVPSGPMERRLFVLDVAEARMQDNDYFAAIAQDMAQGGREAFLHHLLSWPLVDFNVYRVPQTAALAEQKMHSLDPIYDWWLERLQDGLLFGTGAPVAVGTLVDDYIAYCAPPDHTHAVASPPRSEPASRFSAKSPSRAPSTSRERCASWPENRVWRRAWATRARRRGRSAELWN